MFVPVLEMVPQLAPLHPLPLIVHVTLWFVLEQTVALNDCCAPGARLAVAGDTATAGEQV